jgi:hypothetical protein
MPLRVNPIVLLGLTVVLVLSLGIVANAQLGGGSAGDAVGVGEAQLGKPFVMATDGPDTFSCVGLMRHILRTIGVDGDAPWVPEAYLSKYSPVDLANLQPGDIVIYPGWATMYVGNGELLNANEVRGFVTHTPMSYAGVPLGAVRPPYGGSQQPPSEGVADPLMQPVGEGVIEPPLAQPVSEEVIDPPLATEGFDPLATEPVPGTLPWAEPVGGALEPAGGATEPMMQY